MQLNTVEIAKILGYGGEIAAAEITEVSTDSRKAENSETVKSGNNTIAGYYQLPPAAPDGENRFILFRKTSPHDATLIYLEGQTQLDKLINLFINKKQ